MCLHKINLDCSLNSIQIWDSEGQPSADASTTLLWRAFSADSLSECISIPKIIEENADVYKARYLAWIYEFGELPINGNRLLDKMQLRPGLSYWWMTLLAEKSNYMKSPHIDDAIRLLALTDWVAKRSVSHISLTSSSELLAECLRGWCEKVGIVFVWQRLPESRVAVSWLRRAYAALPLTLQALVWLLKYIWERWPLRGLGVSLWRQSQGKIAFVTYSDNCVPEANRQGRYENRYWAHLPDMLDEESVSSNWLHLYIKDGLFTTASHAAVALNAYNNSSRDRQIHVALDSFIGLNVICRTMRDYLRLFRIGMHLGGALRTMPDNIPDFWPLLRADWRVSMFGAVAMNNLLFLNLFETAFNALPQQQQGVYLEENMGWEFGFINAWRGAGHGRLIGTPHATVRYWDLRYFFDQRSYQRTGDNELPLPDLVACNGPVMRAAYVHGGYPVRDLIDVEALRYLHLGQTQRKTEYLACRTVDPVRLLVLGDYLPENTRLQMRLLEHAVLLFPRQLSITVKPHPNCQVHPGHYPTLQMRLSVEPVEKLLSECDVAYASAVTAAAVDAYCAGVPIVSLLNSNTMNLSPLRGCDGALFANTPDELADALITLAGVNPFANSQLVYFNVDAQLPTWRGVLM